MEVVEGFLVIFYQYKYHYVIILNNNLQTEDFTRWKIRLSFLRCSGYEGVPLL